jgi:phytoene dehydrogenase-like protein
MKQYDVIVVGAGIAGLGVAALLSKKGWTVLLLEKESILGGRSTSFEFKGYLVDIGLHAIASLSSSGIGQLLTETGAELEEVPIKPSLMHFDLDSRAYIRATSPERFGQELYQDFIHLVRAVSRMDRNEIDGYHEISAQSWIMDKFGNPGLLEFFKKITGFSGQPMDEVSAGAFLETLNDALISETTICYPAHGGIKALPDCLEKVILSNQGEIITDIRVKRLLVSGDRTVGVKAGIFRPSYIAELDFFAPTVVYTAPLVNLPRFLPAEKMPAEMATKLEKIRSADYYYNGIVLGARSSLMEGFSEQFFQWTFDRPGMDWHGIVTVPTYADPDLAPPGHHLLFIDSHGPMPYGRTDLANQRQEELIALSREIWPDFDRQIDWIQKLIYPTILPLAQLNLTGPHRPGFHVPEIRGLYLAGDATYLTGSGIGSATKSALKCVEEIGNQTNA